MHDRTNDREAGFTLIELLIAIMVSGLILSALSAAFIVAMKGTAGANDRFVESHGAQTLATYFASDVQSANPSWVTTAYNDPTGCSTTPPGTTNVMRLQWAEMTTPTKMTAFSASYRMQQDAAGAEWQLVRNYCTASQDPAGPTATAATVLTAVNPAPTSHVVANDLSKPFTSLTPTYAPTTEAPVVTVLAAKITLKVFAALGSGEAAPYSYSLSANMRTPASELFLLSAPASQMAGSAFNLTVTASKDGTTADTGYTGTAHFSSSDVQATLPGDYTFVAADNGQHTFTSGVTLKTAPSETLTATDTVQTGTTGAATIVVTPAAMNSFVVTAPASTMAGSPFSVTITAKDAYSNTATGYTGAVHFTSSDAQAVLPANYPFVAGDNGAHVFNNGVTLKTSPSQTVMVNDTVQVTKTGSAAVTVNQPAVISFLVAAPASATAGSPFSVTVTARDASTSTITGYTGTVRFTSSDSQAVLPADYTFVAGDNGVHTFTNELTLRTTPSQTVTVTDTVAPATGFATVTVNPGAHHFVVVGPLSTTAGNQFSVRVTVKDISGTTVTGYRGTVHFTSSDPLLPVLPADYTFAAGDNGAHTFTNGVTLKKAPSQTVTVTDTAQASVAGSATVTVNPAAATPSGLGVTDKSNSAADQVTGTASPNVAIRITQTDGDNVGAVYNGTSDGSGSFTVNVEAFVGSNSIQRTFTYSVVAVDAFGNETAAVSVTYTDKK